MDATLPSPVSLSGGWHWALKEDLQMLLGRRVMSGMGEGAEQEGQVGCHRTRSPSLRLHRADLLWDGHSEHF